MPKCFMNVLEDYSLNQLPFICSFQDYYRSSFPISQSGYQPIFYGEVGEVPGVTQDFFVHPAILVARLYGLYEVIFFKWSSKLLFWKYYFFQVFGSPP